MTRGDVVAVSEEQRAFPSAAFPAATSPDDLDFSDGGALSTAVIEHCAMGSADVSRGVREHESLRARRPAEASFIESCPIDAAGDDA